MVGAAAAGDHGRALVDGVLDLRVQVLGRLLARQRGQRRRRVARVAGGEGGERLLQALDERLVDVLGDDQPLGGDAGLAAVLHPAHRGGLDRAPEVLGVEHDERVAAAELEHRLLEVLAGERGDAAAGPLAAGEGDALHERVRDDLLDVGDGEEDVGVDALGHAGVVEALLDRQRGLRVELGVLEQDRVAEHQVRPGDPDDLVERVVPRLDGEDDADRLVLDDRLALHHLDLPRLEEARAVLRVVVEDAGGQLHLAGRPPGCACPSRGSPGRRTRPCARASARRRGRRSARAPRPGGGATPGTRRGRARSRRRSRRSRGRGTPSRSRRCRGSPSRTGGRRRSSAAGSWGSASRSRP